MPEEKMVSVSFDTLYKLQSAIFSINNLASAVWSSALDSTLDGALNDMRLYVGTENADNIKCSYYWMLDHYNEVSAAVQSIRTLADLAEDIIIDLG